MAWIEKRGGGLHLGFRFGGRRFKRSLGTNDDVEASDLLARVERRLRLIEQGDLDLPNDVDLPTFLLSDGRRTSAVSLPRETLLGELLASFFDAIPDGNLEPTTLVTMHVHERHLLGYFGTRCPLSRLTVESLQEYVNARAGGEAGRVVGATTIKKELATFGTVWSWGVETGRLRGEFPRKGIRFPKSEEKPPFRTRAEIDRLLESSPAETALWDSLYLDRTEIDELLKQVRRHATAPFVYPMMMTAAHTGARRSELLRSRIEDVDGDEFVVRERKRVRGRLSTRRVPISERLGQVLSHWLDDHPGGPHTFCQTIKDADGRERIQPITPNTAHDHLRRTLDRGKWHVVRGWHCLRHSFISNLACAGVDQRLIDGFVGHSTEEMRRRYRHLFPDTKRETLRRVF